MSCYAVLFAEAQMEEYRCACCKVPCAACESNFALEDLQERGGPRIQSW